MIKNVIDNQNIVWACGQCAKEITEKDTNEDGISAGLMMSRKEMERATEAEFGWYEHQRNINNLADASEGLKAVSLGEIMRQTKNLQDGDWAVYCSNCIVDKDDDYFIEISRILTVMQFLSWTIHIKQKGWALHTNWDDIASELLSFDNKHER